MKRVTGLGKGLRLLASAAPHESLATPRFTDTATGAELPNPRGAWALLRKVPAARGRIRSI